MTAIIYRSRVDWTPTINYACVLRTCMHRLEHKWNGKTKKNQSTACVHRARTFASSEGSFSRIPLGVGSPRVCTLRCGSCTRAAAARPATGSRRRTPRRRTRGNRSSTAPRGTTNFVFCDLFVFLVLCVPCCLLFPLFPSFSFFFFFPVDFTSLFLFSFFGFRQRSPG